MSDTFGVTDQTLSDAALGDALTNTSGGADLSTLFGGGGGGSSLSDLASSLFGGLTSFGSTMAQPRAVGGGGLTPAAQAQTGTGVNAPSQAAAATVQPAQTSFLSDVAAAGADPPQPGQGQDGRGQGQDSDYAPQSAVNDLKKAMTGQKQQQNPWVTGGGVGSGPMTRQQAIDAGLLAHNAPPQAGGGGSTISDEAAKDAGLLAPEAGRDPQGNRTFPSPDVSGPTSRGQLVPRGNTLPVPATPVPGSTTNPLPQPGASPLGSLAGLARLMGLGPAAVAGGLLLGDTPGIGMETADTGELKPGQPGYGAESALRPIGTGNAPPAPPYRPEDDPQVTPPRGAPGRDPPATAKKPKVDKSIDPKTGKPWVLPTHKPKDEAAPPPESPVGRSRIVEDAGGQQGVPQLLGTLARIALPLAAMMLMGGGGRRGGERRFPLGRFPGVGGANIRGGGFRGGHPGGFGGHWPYHHPQFGWGVHGGHPGGEWRPMSPYHMREIMAERRDSGAFGAGGGQYAPFLAALGVGGGQGQGQGQPGFGNQQPGVPPSQRQGQGGSPGGDWSAPTDGPWSINPFLTNIVGSESGGRNVSVVDSDGQMARGIYQFHDPTWREMAKKVPGASQYARADLAPADVQQAVALATPFNQWGDRTRAAAHRQFGNFDENLTMGQLADQFGGQAWTDRNKTPTGGSSAPQQVATAGGLPVMSDQP